VARRRLAFSHLRNQSHSTVTGASRKNRPNVEEEKCSISDGVQPHSVVPKATHLLLGVDVGALGAHLAAGAARAPHQPVDEGALGVRAP